jgi:PIN domain nuclease of toxin-antitoxin system
MNYLLDTRYLLWVLVDPKKLSAKARDILTNPNQSILVSTVSFWEISLKYGLGKLELSGFSPEDLPTGCEQLGFTVKAPTQQDCSTYHLLKASYHKDPFDRMFIRQAINNDYILMSIDSNVNKYQSEGLKIFAD